MKQSLIALALLAASSALYAQDPPQGSVAPICVNGKMIGLSIMAPGPGIITITFPPGNPCSPPASQTASEPKKAPPRT